MEKDIFEDLKVYLPPYLTPEQKSQLYQDLKLFPETNNYFWSVNSEQDEILQGDGWYGFEVINIETTDKKVINGAIISNSCDIASNNAGWRPRSILFAPLIELDKYIEKLRQANVIEQKISDVLRDIRSQRVTTIFYLPDNTPEIGESIILLDAICNLPLTYFTSRCDKRILFRLQQYGHYLFLIKLSIHFSRTQENVSRFN